MGVAILVLVFVAASLRLDVARAETVVGVDGLAPWWTYVLRNVDALDRGEALESGTLYAPGQSIASWLALRVLDGRDDAAVLRVVFALLDSLAVVFVVLAGKELLSWAAGFAGGLLYALWPAGAAASINLLHDHSPQPLFLFAGLWLVLRAIRLGRAAPLWAGSFLLGLPALFRADGTVVGVGLAAGVGLAVAAGGAGARRACAWAAAAFLGALAPSLPYDAWILARTGRFQHVAMGDAGAAVFMRFGRSSGLAGARWNDSEIAFLGGSAEPFGPAWTDARRQTIPGDFGRSLFWADPARYAALVARELPALAIATAPRAAPTGRFEAALARFFPVRVARKATDPPWIYLGGALGLAAMVLARRWAAMVPAGIAVVWAGALLALLPNSRYLLMPSASLFPLAGAFVAAVLVAPLGLLGRAGKRA